MIEGTEHVLSYKTQEKLPKQPDPVIAMLLCLPGFTCWVLFFGVFLWSSASSRYGFISREWFSLVLFLWLCAVVTAVISIAHYWGTRKPIYVKLCLLVNWAGLVFTLSPLGWISVMVLLGSGPF